jgi:hypothetical protein
MGRLSRKLSRGKSAGRKPNGGAGGGGGEDVFSAGGVGAGGGLRGVEEGGDSISNALVSTVRAGSATRDVMEHQV